MQKPYDMLARGLIEGALSGDCVVRVEEPVVADARSIDALVEPIEDRRSELAGRGFLGRVGGRFCAIEPFHDPPSPDEVEGCHLKVIAHHQRRLAAWQALAPSLRGPAPERAALWVFSAKPAKAALAEWCLEPMIDWPAGCYESRVERAPRVVVVSELPRTRDTFLARWMGEGPTLRRALEDLRALPDDAWEGGVVRSLLGLLRRELPRMGIGVYTESEDTMRYQEALQLHEDEIRAVRTEGLRDGRTEGLRDGRTEGLGPLLRQFERRLGRALTDAERAALFARLDTFGPTCLGDVVLDLDPVGLERWLADPVAT